MMLILGRASFARSYGLLRSAAMSTHVERTQDSTRSQIASEVVVSEVIQLSPSVKGFRLKATNKQLSFKPGQWVDLSIPGEKVVGGYSITSPPQLLAERSELCLAIMLSEHPPALWMNTKCRVGDTLSVRVGGDFYYAPTTPTNLLLIAGGVGINPLYSMLQHHHSLVQALRPQAPSVSARLLFSAKNVRELLFKKEIDRLCEEEEEEEEGGHISANYFTTQESAPSSNCAASSGIPCGRMTAADIAVAVCSFSGGGRGGDGEFPLHCFVCGPPPMTEDMLAALKDLGVEHIHFERWW